MRILTLTLKCWAAEAQQPVSIKIDWYVCVCVCYEYEYVYEYNSLWRYNNELHNIYNLF